MASTANFVATPKCGIGQVSVANTNRDGTGTITTIFTSGANGSRIDSVTVKAVGAVTGGTVRLYLHDGTNARLFVEIPIIATTPSAAVSTFSSGVALEVVIPTGYSLRASTHNAETFNIIVFGGDF